MEKYSKWRDPGTGIQPFLPLKPAAASDFEIWTFVKSYLLGPFLVTIRLSASLGLLTAAFPFYYLISLIPIFQLRRWMDFMVFRCLLFIIGFFWINEELVSLRKGLKRQVRCAPLQSGEVLVCNHVSYLDVLYLRQAYSPIFVQPLSNGSVVLISTWQAVLNSFGVPALGSTESMSLKAAVDKAKTLHRPLIIFPEGVTTNGRGLCKFLPVFRNFPAKTQVIRVLVFRYEHENFSPTTPVDGKWIHFYRLCSQLFNRLEVKLVHSEEVAGALNTSSEAWSNSEDPTGDILASVICQVSRLKRTGLSAKDKQDFMHFYKEKENKGY